jgi:tetratricopeptide (TPR) repeat protein
MQDTQKYIIEIITIIGIIIGILTPLVGLCVFFYRRKKKVKAIYSFTGKSSSLKPKDVLGMRPFKEYYYQRPQDDSINACLKNRKNILIVGPPLSGKTRAAYQALSELNEPQDVAIPICKDINPETFKFPKNTNIIFIDDLHRFVEQQNFDHLFSTSIKNNITIIATCRSEVEYKKVKSKMDLETTFENIIELPRISEGEGKKIAEKVNINWDEVKGKFDKTVGSIFMPLEEMERRFDDCSDEEKTILRALRSLYLCGIYEENQAFPLDWIKTAAKKVGLEGKPYVWTGWLERLGGKEFITIAKEDRVQAEEVYLEHIVKPPAEEKILDVFEEMITTFSGIPDALFRLGNRAYDIGSIDLEKARYMKIVIRAYEEVLKVLPLERFPMPYATTQNNLGNAYSMLAEVEGKAGNCKEAIRAYEEALKVRTLDRFPMDYAMTQNNLGAAYRTLAEVEERAENCKNAIRTYEEALKVHTLERFPMQYATTQHNLGSAYRTLAEVEEKAENCRKAIDACVKALKVRTLKDFPMDYAMTQNNLGAAYQTLAWVEEKAENCRRAIKANEEALKVRTLERFPMDYAMTQNNLGNAYGTLAEVEAQVENCKKAINAYEEALKVRTLERFPMDYATTQFNLGGASVRLSEVEDKAVNCKMAIEAYEEALQVHTLDRFPMDYAKIQWGFGNAYGTLANVEDKAGNCNKAKKAYEEALKVFTKEEFPEVYPLVAGNLRKLLDFMGKGGESPGGE